MKSSAPLAALLLASAGYGHAAADDPAGRPGVAVVELFTSQGCSSCPPADAVLADLADRAEALNESGKDDAVLLPMSLHVDYWDRLGWADPYGGPDRTARQRAYGRALGEGGRVYTPQIVVNGTAGLVGSRDKAVAKLVDAALAEPAAVGVTVEVLPADSADDDDAEARTVRVRYQVVGLPAERPTVALRAVLLSRSAGNAVPRGENAGRTLRHAMVMRSAAAAKLTETTGTLELPLPDDLAPADLLVAAFVQDWKSGPRTGRDPPDRRGRGGSNDSGGNLTGRARSSRGFCTKRRQPEAQ